MTNPLPPAGPGAASVGGGGPRGGAGPATPRSSPLPASLTPRGLSRVEAAAYIGVSPTKFDQMVDDGRMPKPIPIDSRRVWDRQAVDRAFSALPDIDGGRAAANPWDSE